MRCRPVWLALVLVVGVVKLFARLDAEAQQAARVPRIGHLFSGALGLTIPQSFLVRADEVIQ